MTQTLIRPSEVSVAEPPAEAPPAINLNRALANTVISYLRALNRGDVRLEGHTSESYMKIVDKVSWFVDRDVFRASERSRDAPQKDGAGPMTAPYGAVDVKAELEVSCCMDDDYDQAFDAPNEQAVEHARLAADRTNYSGEEPEIYGWEWNLIWFAVRYRAVNGSREDDRQEAKFVSQNIKGMSIAGFDQMPWPTASDRLGECLPEPVVRPGAPLMPHLQKI